MHAGKAPDHCGACPHYETGPDAEGRCRLARRKVERDDGERPAWCPLAKGDDNG